MSEFRYMTTALWQNGATPNPILSELPFTNVNFTQQLNSIGTFTGDLLLSGIDVIGMNALDGTSPSQTCLYVMYGDQIVWGGIIWDRSWDSSTQILSITAQEMMSYFTRRRITSANNPSYYSTSHTQIAYTSKDPCYIANDLISYAQGVSHGNIGLKTTTTTSGYSVSRTYYNFELKQLYQAIKDLSDGLDVGTAQPFFDFAITYTQSAEGSSSNKIVKNFAMGSPYLGNGLSLATTIFQFPGNLVEYTFPEDGIKSANTLYGLGYGANVNKYQATATDDTIGGTISSTGTAALLEDSISLIDVVSKPLLGSITLGNLNAISQPPTTVQVVLPSYGDPQFGTYGVGDFVRLVLQDDRFPNGLSTQYRIVAMNAQPGENGPDRITVTLTKPLFGTGQVVTN